MEQNKKVIAEFLMEMMLEKLDDVQERLCKHEEEGDELYTSSENVRYAMQVIYALQEILKG